MMRCGAENNRWIQSQFLTLVCCVCAGMPDESTGHQRTFERKTQERKDEGKRGYYENEGELLLSVMFEADLKKKMK
jgi:transcriptional regulator of aromatic amino acid metabolism